MRKHVSPVIFTATLSVFILTGCGNDQKTNELSIYQASMETFCDNIVYINDQINALDGSGESDVAELLENLDTLNDQFTQMASLDVPEEFELVEDLADNASENMNMAVTYYHQAYESDPFNQNYADAAYQYYSRANQRLGYILQVLHGEEIQDENIKYVPADEESEETEE